MNMKYKLKDIFDLQMGKTPSRNNTEYWNTEEHKWISIADLTKTGKYISETKECLSNRAIDDSGIKVIPANTVVMSFKLSIGKTAITAEDMYSNEAIMAFHDKHVVKILPEYIYYMFKYKNWDEGSNKAVMGKTLNKATLSEVEIDICSLEEQREIVKVLDKMMSVLDGRETELSLLDDLIKARFVEMFGNPILNEREWNVTELKTVCNGIGDGLHGTPEYDENGEYPFINGNNLMNGAIDITPSTKMVDVETFKKYYIELSDNALLLSINGTLGKLAFYNGEKVMLGKSACYCNLKPDINRKFVYGVMKTDAFMGFLERNATASTIKNVGLKAIRGFKLILPPKELQDQYVEFSNQVNKSKLIEAKSLNLVFSMHLRMQIFSD